MTLQGLLAGLKPEYASGDLAVPVQDITFDSRAVTPGSLFVALPGAKTDGNRFVRQAVSKGAVAVLSELKPPPAPITLLRQGAGGGSVTWVQVGDVFAAMGRVAGVFFGDPTEAMTVVGVTGTNGKTTVTYLLESIFSRMGGTPGVVGTIGVRLRHREIAKAQNTTPFSLELLRLLARMRDGGATHVAMEVSSHALATQRVEEIRFDAAIMTNLQSDHLDFHKTREEYFAAKARLFELLERSDPARKARVAVLNRDDESYAKLRRRSLDVRQVTFGSGPEADYRAEGAVCTVRGSAFRLCRKDREWLAEIKLPGGHNIQNALAAAAAAMELGAAPEAVLEGLKSTDGVPGRLERVDAGQPFAVFVDFAHTTGALATVLEALGALPHRRIITVFGCGGDRDRSKRGPMGAAACAGSDLAIATSDNPRGEDPMDILREIEAGMQAGGYDNYQIVPDRAEAVLEAMRVAQEGDIVLIAGKGHEDTQIFRDRTQRFDDRETARTALKTAGRC
ncbi:MAG: UDP-N-acetylmuramoyl-L-alanyl-D-glutamate--2,6-diaminopimelate ligase [Elusimicrobia bacterium GWA2_69_24]|nr:MAG: UDP-N-acetylmuramoyl-L-alanyl-D-glutamate--2,6-diaminopimelate ligase [Elusimicrobia bacterium GWA2_69_24]